MTASARSVKLYASSYALKKIWRQTNGAVKATATTSEEGEERKRRGAMELKLISHNLSVDARRRGDALFAADAGGRLASSARR